jgi:small-conductance mechanosensitive channel
MKFLSIEVLGNSLLQWGIALAVALISAIGLALGLRLARRRMSAWAQRTSGRLDDLVAAVVDATQPWFVLAMALLAGAHTLTLPERAATVLSTLLAFAVILQAGLWLNAAIGGWLSQYLEQRRHVDASGATTAAILGFIARVVLWTLVLLVALDTFGVDVTALVASLGIGGIAIALAAQNILGDIFASLAIALDKPVVIGDFIVLGDTMGTVEHIGLKTTHLRSLSGELIVVPNNDLLSSRIRNYKRMYERRVVLKFGVTYQTTLEKLREIPLLVQQLVEAQDLTRFDRAHLCGFGASSLDFEVVYFVKDADYNRYMDIQQRIDLGIIAAFEDRSVSFAYPTQTLHMIDGDRAE